MFSLLDNRLVSLCNFTHFSGRFDDIAGIYNSSHATTSKNIVDYGPSKISRGHRIMCREKGRFIIDI